MFNHNSNHLVRTIRKKRKRKVGEIRIMEINETNSSLLMLDQALMYLLGRKKEEKIVRVVQVKKNLRKNYFKMIVIWEVYN
jgi:hypothetical protein